MTRIIVPTIAWARGCRQSGSRPRSSGAVALAAASLYIYVTHFQVLVLADGRWPVVTCAASLAIGLAYRRVTLLAVTLSRGGLGSRAPHRAKVVADGWVPTTSSGGSLREAE